VLQDGGPDHGEGAEDETGGNLLDGCEPDAPLAEEWVDERIHDWHDDDDGNLQRLASRAIGSRGCTYWVEIGENIIRHATEVHGSAHLGQVGVHLTVRKPEDGNPEEDGASSETTRNLVNPGVVKVVPLWGVGTKRGGLDGLPDVSRVPVPPGLEGVDAHTRAESLEEQLESGAHDVAARWAQNVEFLAEDEDGNANDEHGGGNQVSEPETDVTFGVDHADLSNQSTNVDEEVEPVLTCLLADDTV
jgi:hypothetical protein